MVESVDDAMGTIMKTLEELGLSENTLIIFTSDNGGLSKVTNNTPLRSGKGYPYEGGIRVPFIATWPGMIKSGSISDQPVVSMDIFPTFAAAAGLHAAGWLHAAGCLRSAASSVCSAAGSLRCPAAGPSRRLGHGCRSGEWSDLLLQRADRHVVVGSSAVNMNMAAHASGMTVDHGGVSTPAHIGGELLVAAVRYKNL